MAALGPDARPAWTRTVPGSSVLGFLFFTGGLWLGSLLAWEIGQTELGVLLLGLGAFLPLLGLAARLRRRPVWALQVPGDGRHVADLVREALRDRPPTAIPPQEAGQSGIFRGCEPVLRTDEPACLLGVRRDAAGSWTTLLLLPESGDRDAVDRLRVTIERAVMAPR